MEQDLKDALLDYKAPPMLDALAKVGTVTPDTLTASVLITETRTMTQVLADALKAVQDEVTGILCPPGDVAALTAAIDRLAGDPALLPIGATVITADDIRRAGASDVNAAIRKIGGVYGRQSLDASPDFGLDLRGFGSNSSQNLVVMVDGVPHAIAESLIAGLMSGEPAPAVTPVSIPAGNTITIGTAHGSVTMNNFYRNPDYIAQAQAAILTSNDCTNSSNCT